MTHIVIAEGFDGYTTGNVGVLSELLNRGFLSFSLGVPAYRMAAYLPNAEITNAGWNGGKALILRQQAPYGLLESESSANSENRTVVLSFGNYNQSFSPVPSSSFRAKPTLFNTVPFYFPDEFGEIDATISPENISVCPIFSYSSFGSQETFFAVETGGFFWSSIKYDYATGEIVSILGDSFVSGVGAGRVALPAAVFISTSNSWLRIQEDMFGNIKVNGSFVPNGSVFNAARNLFMSYASQAARAHASFSPGTTVFECHYDDFVVSNFNETRMYLVKNVPLASPQYTSTAFSFIENGVPNLNIFNEDEGSLGVSTLTEGFTLNLDHTALSVLLNAYGSRQLHGVSFNISGAVNDASNHEVQVEIDGSEPDASAFSGISNRLDTSYSGMFYTVNYRATVDGDVRFTLGEIADASTEVVIKLMDPTP